MLTLSSIPEPGQVPGTPRQLVPGVITKLAALLAALSAESSRPVEEKPVVAVARLLTPQEMSDFLNIPESKLRADARAGKIPFHRLGRYMRFDKEAVLAAYAATAKKAQ